VLLIDTVNRGVKVLGKNVRMERIMDRSTGRAVIVPLDHGITMGPIDGLVDMRSTIDKVSQGGATSIVLHKGIIPYSHRSFGRDIGLIVHLSASTGLSPHSNYKVIVTTVELSVVTVMPSASLAVTVTLNGEPAVCGEVAVTTKWSSGPGTG
jgi:fructose-bisphosphate aldolase/2-amino-3,7-dideoxy-D-threo-hept-6-ulosonate synthase